MSRRRLGSLLVLVVFAGASACDRRASRDPEPCPYPAALRDPNARVDLPRPEGEFGACDFAVYGTAEIADAETYAQLVTCGLTPPAIDFQQTRLFLARVAAPSEVLGASREPDGRVVVHVRRPGMCSGVDWGDVVHVVALPNDGSPVALAYCAEPSTCAPGEYPP